METNIFKEGGERPLKIDEIVLKYRDSDRIFFRMYFSLAEPGQRAYQEHHHTECEISAIVEGSCQWRIGNQSIWTQRGDVLVFGSDEEHYITEICGQEPLKILNLQFEPRFLWSPGSDLFDSRYLSIFLNHGPDFTNRIPADTETAQQVSVLMHRMRQECTQAKPEYDLMAKAQLLLVLGYLGRHYHRALAAPQMQSGLHLKQLEEALNYIDSNLTGELTLEEIAHSAGMSRSYFCAVFKKLNGLSVWDYITKKRIALAVDYIRKGEHTITQIAILCGYNTMANFNRSFKMVTHCTPSQYRKNL